MATPTVLLSHILALTLGFGLSVALIPLIIRLAHRFDVLDRPDGSRRLHKVAVPRLGGVAVMAATVIAAGAVTLWQGSLGPLDVPYEGVLPGLITGATIVFFTGIADDLYGVRPRLKIVAQSIAAIAVIASGFQIEQLALSTTSTAISLGPLAIPITMLWIVGMTNAFNLIDGVDGLAGTIGLIALATAVGVDLFLHDARMLAISMALLGALFGFLRFNSSPARIFLGDSGSMTLGYFVSIRLVLASTDAEGRTFFLVPLFVLAFPLLDTAISIARRWVRGDPLSRADGRHVHHHMLALGLSARFTVEILGLFFLGVAAVGLSVAFAPPQFTLALLVASGVVVFPAAFYGAKWLRDREFVEIDGALSSVVRQARTEARERVSPKGP